MEQYNHWSQKSHDKALKDLQKYLASQYPDDIFDSEELRKKRSIMVRNTLVVGLILMLGICIGVCI